MWTILLSRLIIEKDKPEFASKLPREVGKLGVKLMRSLNIEQQRAVLRALAAEHYALLRGLPGTGECVRESVCAWVCVVRKCACVRVGDSVGMCV